MPKPNIGLLVPSAWHQHVPSGPELANYFRRAEELGFHSLWTLQRVLHANAVPHPFTILTYAAASTEHMRLGTSVFLMSMHHPVHVARETATLDALAGGRLTLGVSLGGRDPEYDAIDMPKQQRAARLEESVSLLRKLWTEDNVTYEGQYYSVANATVSPKPAQAGGIPIPVGGAAETALKRAGRIGDGWLMGARGTLDNFARNWSVVLDSAREAGRDASGFVNGKIAYANPIGPAGADVAKQEMTAALTAYYGEQGAANQDPVVDTTKQIAAMAQGFGDAGCQTLFLGPPDFDLVRLERLAEVNAML
jgi:probable F420-dependent oxidoreductase